MPWQNGGVSTGLNVWHETLVLNSPGNSTFGDAPLNAELATEALAHALWPSWAYREGRYSLPTQAPVQTAP